MFRVQDIFAGDKFKLVYNHIYMSIIQSVFPVATLTITLD